MPKFSRHLKHMLPAFPPHFCGKVGAMEPMRLNAAAPRSPAIDPWNIPPGKDGTFPGTIVGFEKEL
jgi:hypothetical protein